ncbi:MAG: YerC/YecD family TrpR-related protein [bacterium]|nr:YerC/YecD family TrpR-related protein [bacterium]
MTHQDNELNDLIEALLNIDTKKGMFKFLLGILTPQELEEIPTRLQIVKMLKQGVSQHQIAKRLNVGVATVTRGSKEIQKGRFQNI